MSNGKVIVQETVNKVVIDSEGATVVAEEVHTHVVEVGIPGPQGPAAAIIDGTQITETLTEPDGIETDFELSYLPLGSSLMIYMNGLALTPEDDYSVTGTTVSFSEAPWAGDVLRASYVRGE